MNKAKIIKALPTVLFYAGLAGIFVSEALTIRATARAKDILIKEKTVLKPGEDPDSVVLFNHANEKGFTESQQIVICDTNKEYVVESVKAIWKCFVIPSVSTLATCSLLILSNRLTARQIAALSTAVATAGGLVTKYRDKIREYANDDILRQIDKDIAADTIIHAKTPPITNNTFTSHEELDLNDDGTALFFDPFTGIKFETSKLAFLGAKYYLNRNYAIGSAAPLSMFYEFLGIALPEEYKYAGWEINDDGYNWIDIDVVRSEEPDKETGKMYYIIEYQFEPGDYEDNYSLFPSGNPLDEYAALDSFGSAV